MASRSTSGHLLDKEGQPVTDTSDDSALVLKLTKSYFEGKGDSAVGKLLNKNAAKFYGVESPKD